MSIAKMITVLAVGMACSAAAAACVVQDRAPDGSFTLRNTCSNPVNLKYVYSQSRPMSGAYTTLQPGQRTFDRAQPNESTQFYYCPFPKVPQTLQGGCI